MESVEELCDHIALIHKSNKILDGKLNDIKREFKTNTFEVGLQSANASAVLTEIKQKFEVLPATFRNLNDDIKLNIKIDEKTSSNDLLSQSPSILASNPPLAIRFVLAAISSRRSD